MHLGQTNDVLRQGIPIISLNPSLPPTQFDQSPTWLTIWVDNIFPATHDQIAHETPIKGRKLSHHSAAYKFFSTAIDWLSRRSPIFPQPLFIRAVNGNKTMPDLGDAKRTSHTHTDDLISAVGRGAKRLFTIAGNKYLFPFIDFLLLPDLQRSKRDHLSQPDKLTQLAVIYDLWHTSCPWDRFSWAVCFVQISLLKQNIELFSRFLPGIRSCLPQFRLQFNQ